MVEKLRFLEVGFGNAPAVIHKGTLFDSSDTSYYGVDYPTDKNFNGEQLLFASTWDITDGIRHAQDTLSDRQLEGLEVPQAFFTYASATDLPFPDEKFDYLLMRSIFGQYSMPPQAWKTGLEELVVKGLHEANRVLKPKGKIVILEENTPRPTDVVKYYLRDIGGFSITDFAEMDGDFEDKTKNIAWRKLRDPYFQTRSTQNAGSVFLNSPYILIGEKPEA